ncbi:MAG TPA: PAS domain S-box protein [Verrucomicrobiae bacterium]|nr:PAS domain S-box protein [Verrucomicrobiae bacterium]
MRWFIDSTAAMITTPDVAKLPVTEKPPRNGARQRGRSRAPAVAPGPSRRSKEELRRSEQNLLTIIENTPECIKIVACDGTIVSMNPAGLSLVEAESPSAVVGRSVFDLISPEFREAFRELHQKVCAGEKCELEYEIIGLKGARRWMHTRAAPIPHPDTGEPAHLAITRDITERKQAERTISLNEERLRLATFSEAITLYEQDSQLRYTWLYPLKPQFRPSLGRTDREILQNEEGAFLERIKTEVMRTGQSQRHVVSATFGNQKTYYDLLVSPRRNAQGDIVGVAGAALDITERKLAEEALRESETCLRELVEALPAAVYTTDAQGRITMFNQAAVQFSGRVPQIGTDSWCVSWKLYTPDGHPLPHDQCPMAVALKEGRPVRGQEAIAERPDGTRIHFIPYPTPVRDKNGKVIGGINMLVDITPRKQAEEKLRESEALLQTELADSRLLQRLSAEIVFESNTDALYQKLVDAAAAIMRSDFASMQMFYPERGTGELRLLAHRGFDPAAARGWQWVSRNSPSSCGEALRRKTRVLAPDIETCEFLGKEGLAAYRSAGIRSMQSTPLLSRSGELVGMISTHWPSPHQPTERELRLFDILARQAADVIEHRRADLLLRQSEEQFRNIFNQSMAGIAQIGLDGGYLLVNERFCEITGYSAAQLQTKTSTEVTCPEDRARDRALFENALRDGKPYFIEKRYVRPDGSLVWVRNNVSQMKGADGRVCRMLAVSLDITEQKRAQETSARLAAIVEHSDDAIFSTDLDATIQSWNRGAERLYGYSEAEVVGRSIAILAPNGHDAEQSRIFDLIRQGQTVENYETNRRRKNGSVFDVSLTVSPVKDSNGRIIGVSKVARDITEKVRAREILEQTVAQRTARLEQALAQMEDFTYTVSHDLRAPARAIRGIMQAAIEDFANIMPPELRGQLEKISRSAERMDQLIRDILDYSRVSRAEVKLLPVQLDLLIPAIISERPDMQPQRAQINIRAPLGSVLAHEPSLAQAITNLLANAVKFVPPGATPTVELRTERNNGSVRLWITDNGIGINPKYHHRLFNVFERANDSALYDGTGIGLAIVRKAAEKMGGKVGLVSDGLSGSSFWIELPAASV